MDRDDYGKNWKTKLPDNEKRKELKKKLEMKKNQLKHQRAKKTKQAKNTKELFQKVLEMKQFVDKEDPPSWIIEEKYSKIKEKYPTLYDMICEKGVDIQMLAKLFAVMEQIELKNITNEKADKYVGQMMADKYVTPIVDEMDKS